MDKKVAFIGAGSMAEAIISGIIYKDLLSSDQIAVANKNNRERLKRLEEKYQIRIMQNKEAEVTAADIVVLSTKPYDLKEAILSVKPYIRPEQIIISVIAGISTDEITALIGKDNPVIRAMPNTSASIGFSATALSAGTYASEHHLHEAEALFTGIGATAIVDEQDMHIVTGISGSGPAYFYYMVEAMEDAAVDSGLSKETARLLITQTIIGAGEMLKQSEEPAADLRRKIMSPAGTTEAGISALDKNNFQQIIRDCVTSAKNRSMELGESKND
ncbi:pyrroline-5-carboxylate reductase [Virgibacillus kimchii]